MAFDLLHLDGDDLRLRPIEARREVLMRLIAGADGIVCSEALVAEGTVMFAKACEFGREGIVSKRKGNFYKFGKSRHLAEDEDPGFRQDVNRSSSMRPNVCKICEAL